MKRRVVITGLGVVTTLGCRVDEFWKRIVAGESGVHELRRVVAERLVRDRARHRAQQVSAGADCVQIFESWAEGLPPHLFERLIIRPTQVLLQRLRCEILERERDARWLLELDAP